MSRDAGERSEYVRFYPATVRTFLTEGNPFVWWTKLTPRYRTDFSCGKMIHFKDPLAGICNSD